MQATATLRHVRISPRKVRLIARELPGRSFLQAESVLEFLPNKATQALLKLLRSAVANAENRGVGTKADLRVKEVAVNQGRTLKRFRPRSRGMMHPFARRSSHITIVLEGPGGVRVKQKPERAQADEKEKQGTKHPLPRFSAKAARKAPRKLMDAGKRVFRRKSI